MNTAAPKLEPVAVEQPRDADPKTGSTKPWAIGQPQKSREDTASPNDGTDRMPAWHARRAGRELARMVPEAERRALNSEHNELTEKQFSKKGLTPTEKRRLVYVRWSLDRLLDADIGDDLDALETLAALQERIADDVERVVDQVSAFKRPAPQLSAKTKKQKKK